MTTPSYLDCIHCVSGLCPSCQDEYDTDPEAWVEFGMHTEGCARWEALQKEMAAEYVPVAEGNTVDLSEIPF